MSDSEDYFKIEDSDFSEDNAPFQSRRRLNSISSKNSESESESSKETRKKKKRKKKFKQLKYAEDQSLNRKNLNVQDSSDGNMSSREHEEQN